MSLDLELRPPSDEPEPRPPGPAAPSRTRLWSALAVCIVLLGLGVWLVAARLPHWLATSDVQPATPSAAPGAGTEARKIQGTLFYVSEDGTSLIGVNHDVVYAATPAEQARRLVEAEVAEPPNERASAIPKGTTVHAVFLTETHEAYVDLGGTIASGFTGGSLDEALAVYAIVNAVIVNLPDVTAVQILIDGKEVDSLGGHLDLRAPLGKAVDWIQKGP
jgi:hypothetical protein